MKFIEKEIAKAFKLGKMERELLSEKLLLEKKHEKERKAFINLLKSWIMKWRTQ